MSKNNFTISEDILPLCKVGLEEQTPLQGTAPRGFVKYQDGMYHGYARKSDGAGLRDLHNSGECPGDCCYCRGDNKKAEATADHAGMKAQATSAYWKSGRNKKLQEAVVEKPSYKCPVCGRPTYYKSAEGWRPFCSEACAKKGTK